MASDGLFPAWFVRINARTLVPTGTIILQGAVDRGRYSAIYEQILSYVVVMDCLFFGLTATCISYFERERSARPPLIKRALGSRPPLTTGLFVAIAWFITLNTIYKYPAMQASHRILFAGFLSFTSFAGARRSIGRNEIMSPQRREIPVVC
jgi:APA family basic amino acid/polyamine antiporter